MITHQSQVINALQNESQSLHKKQIQITKSNQALQESENELTVEMTSLKEQVTAFWQNSTDDKHMANSNAIQ